MAAPRGNGKKIKQYTGKDLRELILGRSGDNIGRGRDLRIRRGFRISVRA